MPKNLRPIAYVLASTNHGSMLVNRYDYHMTDAGGYGVGYQILNTSAFDSEEIDLSVQLISSRRQYFGDGVIVIDCGANIGVHTVEWSKLMYGWGEVIAFEAQERIFYALAGNVALNNCFNARVVFAAVGADSGEMLVPTPNYFLPSSFGSLELRPSLGAEFIGQQIDYSVANCEKVKMTAIDHLELSRLDFIKIDIEGMELDALIGAQKSIARFKPQLFIEKIKSNEADIRKFLEPFDYRFFSFGISLLALHASDPVMERIRVA